MIRNPRPVTQNPPYSFSQPTWFLFWFFHFTFRNINHYTHHGLPFLFLLLIDDCVGILRFSRVAVPSSVAKKGRRHRPAVLLEGVVVAVVFPWSAKDTCDSGRFRSTATINCANFFVKDTLSTGSPSTAFWMRKPRSAGQLVRCRDVSLHSECRLGAAGARWNP